MGPCKGYIPNSTPHQKVILFLSIVSSISTLHDKIHFIEKQVYKGAWFVFKNRNHGPACNDRLGFDAKNLFNFRSAFWGGGTKICTRNAEQRNTIQKEERVCMRSQFFRLWLVVLKLKCSRKMGAHAACLSTVPTQFVLDFSESFIYDIVPCKSQETWIVKFQLWGVKWPSVLRDIVIVQFRPA